MIKVLLYPLKIIWRIFDNDAHNIVSKRGWEILNQEQNGKETKQY